MLGTERERVLKFYFSRLQRNSRVNLIFSGLFLKRLLYYGYVIRYLASYDKEWRIKMLWFNGWKINQDISFIILNEISYMTLYYNCQSYRLTTCTQCVPIFAYSVFPFWNTDHIAWVHTICLRIDSVHNKLYLVILWWKIHVIKRQGFFASHPSISKNTTPFIQLYSLYLRTK
jgi:hypothetical protein